MEPDSTDLNDIYLKQLSGLLTEEKKYGKILEKLTSAAATEELKSALALTLADLQQQKERIEQCLVVQKRKATAAINGTDPPLLERITLNKLSGKPSVFKDIKILHNSQQIFLTKVIAYKNLQLMAGVLEQDHAVLLLEQSANDNQNNYRHLLQISGNIIYPETKTSYKKGKTGSTRSFKQKF